MMKRAAVAGRCLLLETSGENVRETTKGRISTLTSIGSNSKAERRLYSPCIGREQVHHLFRLVLRRPKGPDSIDTEPVHRAE